MTASNRTSLISSGKIARQTLKHLTQFEIPVTPPNYAVWYEYFAGSNEPLHDAVEMLADRGVSVTEDVTQALHLRFIAKGAEARLRKAEQSLKTILNALLESVRAADEDLKRFGGALCECLTSISAEQPLEDVSGVVSSLMNETGTTRERTAALAQQLKDTTAQVQTLQEELHKTKKDAN